MKTSFFSTRCACYLGYIVQAVVNNFPPLLFLIFQGEFGLSLEQLSLLITGNFAVQLLTDLSSALFVDRIGYRPCIVAAHAFCMLGLLGLSFLPFALPPFWGLLLSTVVYGIGGGLIEVLISPILEACPTKNKAAEMSLLHSFYCWGAALVIGLTTAFFSLDAGGWRLAACLWAALPAGNAILFLFSPISAPTEPTAQMPIGSLVKRKRFLAFFLLMFAAGAAELGMSQWASALAESGLNVPKAVGDLAGPCAFALCMGISRLLYATLGKKVPLLSALLFCGGLCTCAYLLTALAPYPFLSLIGCALVGLGVGILWPGIFSLAAETFPSGGTPLFALLALGGDIGCTAGPTLIGFLAGACGDDLQTGLCFAALFPLLIVLIALACKHKDKS